MSDSASTPDSAQRLLPWLLVLPLVLLAWPSQNGLAGDLLTTELSSLGFAALALLPLGAWFAWQRPRPSRGSTLLFIALFLPANFGNPTDSLELDRALITFLTAFLVANGAAHLGKQGQEFLVRALTGISILLLVPALLGADRGWGGALGNSGELSGAALPGALCGLVLWTRSAGKWQWLGMAAVGLFLLHALLAPVIAALVALVVVIPVTLFCMRGASSAFVPKSLGMLLLVLAGFAWIKWAPTQSSPSAAGEEALIEQPADHFGGFEVRRLVWKSSLALFMDEPLFGVGLGQFAVRFPQYRDARERELSNHGHEVQWTTEVEHPHNDWILPWIEGGLISGLAWLGFLYFVMQAAIRALGRAQTIPVAMGAASLGGLLAAGFNSPLLYNPTASIALFALFGAILGPGKPVPQELRKRTPFGPLLILGMVLFLGLHVPRALALVRHGAALGEMAHSTTETERDEAILQAAGFLEDSVTARSLAARVLERRDGDLEGALAHWNRVLALRPLRFDARMQRGVLLARMARYEEAQLALDKAFELDPTHPALLRNRTRLAVESGHLEAALTEVVRLVALGQMDSAWLMGLGCEEVLRGRIEAGMTLLELADPRFAITIAEQAYALESSYRLNGEVLAADGFKALANVLWARTHAAQGNWGNARRSYFQALRIQRNYVQPAGPLSTRVEHACATWLKGDRAEAKELLADVDLGELNFTDFPQWCAEALFGMLEK